VNTLLLKYAVEVAKTGSITLAAQNLYMNQPNLSKAIKELEASIGINIFKRTPKGIIPTKQGEEFLSYAKNILIQIDEMESLYKTDQNNKITFSVSIPRASYITHAFTLFAGKLDDKEEMELNFKETNSMRTIRDVAEGECRLGIIRYQKDYEKYFLDFIKDKKLKHEDIWEFIYIALMSNKSPLAAKEKLVYSDLNPCIEIVHGDLSVPHLSSSEIKKEEKFKKRRIYIYERGSQMDLLNQIPDSFMWVSPLPKEMLNRYGLIQRRCYGADQVFKDVLIYSKDYRFSKFDEAFLNEVQMVKESML
jgi:DNA-binding transcriptional LysR family regulator